MLSRQRPALLARCLAALRSQDHPACELVLVADRDSLGTCPDLPIRRIPCDQPNVSVARNLGLRAASGEVVAFIDDDALAVPAWARRIAAAFADARVLAATGYTRGPDGLGWQVRAERLTPSGTSFAINPQIPGPWLALPAERGCPVSTIGTNCAFRRDALLKIGGFDPAFPYYLDESDVNMRLLTRFPDALTAIVPGAEVIHGIAAGPLRSGAGVPLDLFDVGRSAAVFARRHGGGLPPLMAIQRRRLLRHMVSGRLDPFGVGPLLERLQQGIRAGQAEPPAPWPAPWPDLPGEPFQPLSPTPPAPQRLCVFVGWHWQRHRLRENARQAVADDQTACLLLLSPTALPHRLSLCGGGWWEQSGGLWGWAGPDTPAPGLSLLRRSKASLAADFRLAMSCRFQKFI